MPDPKPTPPKGYNLIPLDSSVPSFIRSGMDTSKIKQTVEPFSQQGAPSMVGTETVSEATPGKIAVYDPSRYTSKVRDHEMTHEFQQSRSDGTVKLPGGYALAPLGVHPAMAPEQYAAGDPRNYDYGGQAGLQSLRSAHKTAANLNQEQQADMVADYKAKQDAYLAKVKAGTATPADLRAMYATHEAYHPFIQQMANVPNSFRNSIPSLSAILGTGKPQQLAPAPAAPGLPSYDTPGLGVAPADPLLGGKSAPIPSAQLKSMVAQRNPAVQGKEPVMQPGDGHTKSINPYPNPEDRPPDESLAFNKAWTKPGWKLTTLSPQDEAKFQVWAKQNAKAIQGELNNPKADYDVRGHWAAAQRGDPAATLVLNKWDGKMHGNDKFKTPYNGGFSNESMYATPNAPRWVGDKLMTADGRTVTDETPKPKPPTPKIGQRKSFPSGKIGIWDGHGWAVQ